MPRKPLAHTNDEIMLVMKRENAQAKGLIFEFVTHYGIRFFRFPAYFVGDIYSKVEHAVEMHWDAEKELRTCCPRGVALCSLLCAGQRFENLESFAVACRNALGDSIDTFQLTGSIFINGECVDELIVRSKAEKPRAIVRTPADQPLADPPLADPPLADPPLDRNPPLADQTLAHTNAEIVRRMVRDYWQHDSKMDTEAVWCFEFRTEYQNDLYSFRALFVDMVTYRVVYNSDDRARLRGTPRGKALLSLLSPEYPASRIFKDVEEFAVACRNALGDNVDAINLAAKGGVGKIFIGNECVALEG